MINYGRKKTISRLIVYEPVIIVSFAATASALLLFILLARCSSPKFERVREKLSSRLIVLKYESREVLNRAGKKRTDARPFSFRTWFAKVWFENCFFFVWTVGDKVDCGSQRICKCKVWVPKIAIHVQNSMMSCGACLIEFVIFHSYIDFSRCCISTVNQTSAN